MGLEDLLSTASGLRGIATELRLLREAVERVGELLEATSSGQGRGTALRTGPRPVNWTDQSAVTYFGEEDEGEKMRREAEEFEQRTGLKQDPYTAALRTEREEVSPGQQHVGAGWLGG